MNYSVIGTDKSLKVIGAMSGDGALTMNRGLAVGGHNSVIGTSGQPSIPETRVPSTTSWRTLGESYMPTLSPGTWLLMCSCSFQGDQDGNRALRWYNTAIEEGYLHSEIQSPACSGARTELQTVCTVNLTSAQQLVPQVWQNSGVSLNVNPRVRYTRIA